MTPKFKIGERVKTNYITEVFYIHYIIIFEKKIRYGDKDANEYDEENISLYTEPKPKVKKYLWAYRIGNKPPVVSGYFHENESDFKNDPHGQITWCKRLDWSEIEVEE